jgi:hypothetical protein
MAPVESTYHIYLTIKHIFGDIEGRRLVAFGDVFLERVISNSSGG